jgi:hypothetical protein
MSALILEIREDSRIQAVAAKCNLSVGGSVLMVTPPINEDYWLFRVKVSEDQSIVGFPKFGIIGIGFAKEEADWNTNLPSQTPALQIFNHISHNKGDDSIPDARCIQAIEMIQEAVKQLRAAA